MVPEGKFVESPGERRVRRVVDRLLKEPREAAAREARGEPRQPFFRPVSLSLRNGPVEELSAFTREISASGVGLLHNAPVPSGETVITLLSDDNFNSFLQRTVLLQFALASESHARTPG